MLQSSLLLALYQCVLLDNGCITSITIPSLVCICESGEFEPLVALLASSDLSLNQVGSCFRMNNFFFLSENAE